ncbi:hypothetical protein HGM15179_021343, partial [Zosterops borbonicus]
PGLGPTIQLGEQTLITVDAKAAGKGKVTCSVCTPDGSEVDVDVVENPDGTFDIFYTAPQPGKYVICVRFGGEHIPNSPFQVMATDRPLLGVNGLDMAGLRPFDLVIPFTIKKGEITGENLPKIGPKIGENLPKIGPKIGENLPKIGPKIGENLPKIGPKIGENLPKIGPKIGENRPQK